MTYYNLMSILLLLINRASFAPFFCGPNIEPCKCYTADTNSTELSELVCNDVTITAEKLYEIGQRIKGDAYLLHITKAKTLTSIKKGTFIASFKKIFIENNDELISIENGAFANSSITVTLAIRNNPKLNSSAIDVAKYVAKEVVDIEFENNAFEELVEKSFVDFPKVNYIRLDKETPLKPLIFKDDVFANLPNIKQLSLNGYTIGAVGKNVINLSATLGHVTVFLQNSKNPDNIKKLLSTDSFILPKSNNVSIDLELSDLNVIPDICKTITSTADGVCFLKNTKIVDCTCANHNWVTARLRNDTTKNNIQGLSELKCDSNTILIKDCKLN